MDLQTVTSTDVQRGFGKFLDNLTEPVIIMRDSRPEAVVVDYFEYLELKEVKEKSEVEKLEKLLDKVHAKNAHISVKKMKKDIEEALKYVRSHRRHKHLH